MRSLIPKMRAWKSLGIFPRVCHLLGSSSWSGSWTWTALPPYYPSTAAALQYVQRRNAGHSKWANIKHTKTGKDAERAYLISKHLQLIRTSIKEGGGSPDPKLNKKLADAVELARSNQVPVENIQRALTAAKEGKDTKPLVWPVKGPGGSVIIMEIETDHVGKTRQEITAIARRNQFLMTDLSSVMYQFNHKGVILCSAYNGAAIDESHLDEALAHAIDSGAEDVTVRRSDPEYGTVFEFLTEPDAGSFFKVKNSLVKLNYTVVYSEVDYIAANPVELSEESLSAVSALCDKLLSHSDVTRLYHNIEETKS